MIGLTSHLLTPEISLSQALPQGNFKGLPLLSRSVNASPTGKRAGRVAHLGEQVLLNLPDLSQSSSRSPSRLPANSSKLTQNRFSARLAMPDHDRKRDPLKFKELPTGEYSSTDLQPKTHLQEARQLHRQSPIHNTKESPRLKFAKLADKDDHNLTAMSLDKKEHQRLDRAASLKEWLSYKLVEKTSALEAVQEKRRKEFNDVIAVLQRNVKVDHKKAEDIAKKKDLQAKEALESSIRKFKDLRREKELLRADEGLRYDETNLSFRSKDGLRIKSLKQRLLQGTDEGLLAKLNHPAKRWHGIQAQAETRFLTERRIKEEHWRAEEAERLTKAKQERQYWLSSIKTPGRYREKADL